MRLFTAIELHSDLLLPLERLLSVLRPEALVKWSPLDNLHITLKFIGEWPESRLSELNETLSRLHPCEPFEIELKNLGWFPNERSPRVLWAGVDGGAPLQSLAGKIESHLEPLGIARETRDFSPHLTLARIKAPTSLRRLRQKVQELQPAQLGAFQANTFALFRSDPGSNSSIYRKLYDYNLESALAAS